MRARHFYTFWQIGLQLKPTTNAVHAYLYYVANVSLTLMHCNSVKIIIRQLVFCSSLEYLKYVYGSNKMFVEYFCVDSKSSIWLVPRFFTIYFLFAWYPSLKAIAWYAPGHSFVNCCFLELDLNFKFPS